MERERDANDRPGGAQTYPMFVPILLVVIALFLMTSFQSIQLVRERELLKSRLEGQQGPVEESQNVRQQLQSVATSTAKLAKQGNENAAQIVEQLQRAGITINLDNAE